MVAMVTSSSTSFLSSSVSVRSFVKLGGRENYCPVLSSIVCTRLKFTRSLRTAYHVYPRSHS